jgi:glutamate-1-semialdehyde 2,1-aminomutase
MDGIALSLYERSAIIPGRSMTKSKAVFQRFAGMASGSIITDTDGNAYIDTLAALGAATLGYHHPIYECGVCSLPYAHEVHAAEAVLEHVAKWASWCRFVKTGSEATTAAVRIARAATKREKVIRCVGSYHGWHEWCQEPGTLERYHLPVEEDVAAVFIEPQRFAEDSRAWLEEIRCWCSAHGALLVFDSMVYGGRWAIGGASEYYNLKPDLECFGKGLAGGASCSFVVGTDNTYAYGDIPSGTFTGELSGMEGVLDAIHTYTTRPVIETLWAKGQRLLDGFKAVILPELGEVEGFPVCFRIKYHHDANGPKMTQAMLQRGVILHPLPILVMYSHTDQQIDYVIAAAKESAECLMRN